MSAIVILAIICGTAAGIAMWVLLGHFANLAILAYEPGVRWGLTYSQWRTRTLLGPLGFVLLAQLVYERVKWRRRQNTNEGADDARG